MFGVERKVAICQQQVSARIGRSTIFSAAAIRQTILPLALSFSCSMLAFCARSGLSMKTIRYPRRFASDY